MLTIETFRTWFKGHNSCSPYYRTNRLKGISMKDFDHSSFMLLMTYEGWVHVMAGKKNTAGANWNSVEFINRPLIEKEKVLFKTWVTEEGEKIVDLLGQAMVDNYRMSCNWDDNNQCFIATLTGKPDQRNNASRALSARSDDWWEAQCMVCFKHIVLFKSSTWEGEGTKNNWG